MLDFVDEHAAVFWLLGVASVVTFVVSLAVMPAIAVRIPSDYFQHAQRPPSRWRYAHPMLRATMLVAKNLLGVILMIGGLAMLALPGQGLLTLLIGFFLIDFPRKYQFEKWLVRRRAIHRPINWLRRRFDREPLRIDMR